MINLNKPSFEEIKSKVLTAIETLQKKDVYLLDVNVNERSVCHKFAEYLQIEFGPSWNVDCEFNRNGLDIKKMEFLSNLIGTSSANDTEAKTIYPDIIVHKRGDEKMNLLVIEAKKKNGDEKNDVEKLKMFTQDEEFKYEWGLF